MTNSPDQALLDARKLVRSFRSAPDPRHRAQEIVSELRRADGWSAKAQDEIATTEAWLTALPATLELEGRLRVLLSRLG